MKDHWKIFDGVAESKDSIKDVAWMALASLVLASIIYRLIEIM